MEDWEHFSSIAPDVYLPELEFPDCPGFQQFDQLPVEKVYTPLRHDPQEMCRVLQQAILADTSPSLCNEKGVMRPRAVFTHMRKFDLHVSSLVELGQSGCVKFATIFKVLDIVAKEDVQEAISTAALYGLEYRTSPKSIIFRKKKNNGWHTSRKHKRSHKQVNIKISSCSFI